MNIKNKTPRSSVESKKRQALIPRLAKAEARLKAAISGLPTVEVGHLKETSALLRETRKTLQESEAKYLQLLSRIPAAIFIIQGKRIRYANPAAKDITGFSIEELLDKEFWEIAHPRYQEFIRQRSLTNQWENDWTESQEPENPTRFELKLLTKYGESRWVDLSAASYEYKGEPAWIITAFDLTERDWMEQELRKAKAELELRVEARTAELRESHRRLQAVLEALPVAVWISDAEGRIIEKNRAVDEIWGVNAPLCDGIEDYHLYRGWWDETGEVVRAEDWALARALSKGETSKGEVINIQSFNGKNGAILNSAAPFYDEDGQLVGAVAVAQDISERKRYEDRLIESEQKFRGIVEHSVSGIALVDEEGIFIEWNPGMEKITGIRKAEVINRSILDFHQQISFLANLPFKSHILRENMLEFFETGELPYDSHKADLDIMHKDGTRRSINISIFPIKTEAGYKVGFTVYDITESKHIQDELRKAHDQLDAVFNGMSDAVVVYDAEGEVVLANPAAVAAYGFDPVGLHYEELSGKLLMRFPDGRPLTIDDMPSRQTLFGRTVRGQRLIYKTQGEEDRIIIVSTSPLIVNGVIEGAVVVWQDVTEREQLLEENMQQEQRLRRKKALLETIFETTVGGLAVVAGPNYEFKIANPAYRSLTPNPEIDPIGRPFSEIWPPMHEQRLQPLLQRVMETGETIHTYRYGSKTSQGDDRFFSIHARPFYWEDEPAVLIMFWETTILEEARRQAERSAEEARQRADELDAIFSAMSEAVMIFDRSGNLVKANPVALEAFSVDRAIEDGRLNLNRLFVRDSKGRRLKDGELPIKRVLRGETVDNIRYLYKNSKGEEYILLASASPLHTNGKLAAVVVVLRDVTERERLLNQLEAERARLSTIIANIPEALIVADENGRVVMTNPAAESMYGGVVPLGMDMAEGSDLQVLYPDGTPYDPRDLPLTRCILDHETQVNLEMAVLGRDGRQRYLLVNSAPILDRKSKVSGAISIFQDITPRKQTEENIKAHAARSAVLAKLHQAFAEPGLDFSAVLNTVARNIAEAFDGSCLIRLVSPDKQWLEIAAFHHVDRVALNNLAGVLTNRRDRSNEGLPGVVYQSGNPIFFPDFSFEEIKPLVPKGYWYWFERLQISTLLIVPLKVRGGSIGTLSVQRYQPKKPFTLDDQKFVQDLADRAALAIENARLYQLEARRASELDALHSATASLLTTLDLETLLSQILDAAQRAIPAVQNGMLHLIAPDDGNLRIRASFGFSDPRISTIDFPLGKHYAAEAVQDKRPKIIYDALAGPVFVEKPDSEDVLGIRSALVAPLILGEEVLGSLSLTSTRPRAFNEEDLHVLVSFAATTTAAIHNAMLHTEVQRLAVTDPLTGCYNRRSFFEIIQRELDRMQRFNRPSALIMLDVDKFKEINDRYGHTVGDAILRHVTDVITGNIRQVDVMGRYGGDEFAILLPETALATANDIAGRIREAVERTNYSDGDVSVSLSVSIGVVAAKPDSNDIQALFALADSALYMAKNLGRNRVESA